MMKKLNSILSDHITYLSAAFYCFLVTFPELL